MSKLDWRNNTIIKLIGDPSDKEIAPTYAQYLVWISNCKRSITSVGADYLNKLITKIEDIWDGASLPILGPDPLVPDDITSLDF